MCGMNSRTRRSAGIAHSGFGVFLSTLFEMLIDNSNKAKQPFDPCLLDLLAA